MIKILHIITASEQNKGVGGAETLLLAMLKEINRDLFKFVIAYSSKGPLIKEFIEAGADVVPFDTYSQLDLMAIKKLIDLIRIKDVNLIHSHQPRFDFLACIAAKITKTPFIFTRHLSISESPINKVKKIIFLMVDKLVTVRLADKIISASKSIADDLIQKENASKEKSMVIYAGLDLKVYDKYIEIGKIRKEFSIDSEVPLVGMIGRINAQKAHQYLLQAATEVIRGIPNAKFLIVGDGPLRKKQEKLAEDLGINTHIIFTGQRKDIPEIMADMDIAALSSLTEALAVVNLEAMVMRKPVVSFDVGGVAELVVDNETGFLIISKDTRAFANAIINLIKDKDKAKKMGIAGRKRVEENFTLELMVKKHEELYSSILKPDL
ncbi:MAG: glycosyltransferase [Candidatus Omnitrophota bacterium]